jgi:Mrp family chromosome partitioning ATPase
MSRNFELLQRAGWGEQYLEGVPSQSYPEPERKPRENARRPGVGSDPISILVQRVFLRPSSPPVRSVVFSCCDRKTPAPSVCVQAAMNLAKKVEGRVCVVDANPQSPSLHRLVGEEHPVGLADALSRSRPAANFAKQVRGSSLWCLPLGTRNVLPLVDTANMISCLRDLQKEFAYLLIEGPTITSEARTVRWGQAADGAVLILAASGITPELAQRAKSALQAARVRLLGVVLQ